MKINDIFLKFYKNKEKSKTKKVENFLLFIGSQIKIFRKNFIKPHEVWNHQLGQQFTFLQEYQRDELHGHNRVSSDAEAYLLNIFQQIVRVQWLN